MSNPISSPSASFSSSSDVEEEVTSVSSTPTPYSHLHSHRSQSQSHTPGQTQTSYFGSRPTPNQRRPAQPPPILMRSSSTHSTHGQGRGSGGRQQRSTSLSSSGRRSISASRQFRDDEAVSEVDEGNPETSAAADVDAEVDADDADDIDADEEADADESLSASHLQNLDLKARQSLINVQHPFGLPIWKPALYKKSRSVTRYADEALHSIPSAKREKEERWALGNGNWVWVVVFGWWMALVVGSLGLLLGVGEGVGVLLRYVAKRFRTEKDGNGVEHGVEGGYTYATLTLGLAWYIFWPFGKYVEGLVVDDECGFDEYGAYPYPYYDDDEDGEAGDDDGEGSNHTVRGGVLRTSSDAGTGGGSTIRGIPTSGTGHQQTSSWIPTSGHERTSLLPTTASATATATPQTKSYGTISIPKSTSPHSSGSGLNSDVHASQAEVLLWDILNALDSLTFHILFIVVIAPLLLSVSLICWGLVLTIPMAKLNWALIRCIWEQPRSIRFRAAPDIQEDVLLGREEEAEPEQQEHDPTDSAPPPPPPPSTQAFAHPAPTRTSLPKFSNLYPFPTRSAVLLCTYRALGLKYYKYTLGGVNIMFVNLLFVVFFVIFDWGVLLTWVEELDRDGRGDQVSGVVRAVSSQGVIFLLSLASVIPLSYFIGMAVASISAQSSIGMGAVINATFGSIIEILLYSIALVKGKGRLVEGSIVGSLLAGVGLMPGMSMVSSALKRKETRFNAGSAGVTSVMLIMAIVGALTPTLFYQTYGNFQLICTGCPNNISPLGLSSLTSPNTSMNRPWVCDQCFYQHPDPVHDPFYQSTVKSLMFFCAAVLIFSYLVGLWFSLRTHASQIWQNPQQLLNPMDMHLPVHNQHLAHPQNVPMHSHINPHGIPGGVGPGIGGTAGRTSMYTKFIPTPVRALSRRASIIGANLMGIGSNSNSHPARGGSGGGGGNPRTPTSPTFHRRVSYAPAPSIGESRSPSTATTGFTPLIESVDQVVNQKISTLQLPDSVAPLSSGSVSGSGLGSSSGAANMTINVTTEDFTRAVTVATVSALKIQAQQQNMRHGYSHSPGRARDPPAHPPADAGGGGHGGHDAPSWSRFTSASVLLGCTALYAVIAEILIDVIDVILGDSGLDEKFLGVTLLALVPNTTEFMNAISFALNGNIALSMEIGSAYALQVCLLQIPAMVAFSAWWFPDKLGEVAHTFSLIFPRWDVIAIILSMFLLTYTYIEAKSNYHRGSILILSYLVLIAGFYYAPRTEDIHHEELNMNMNTSQQFDSLTFLEYARWWVGSWW